MSVLGTIRRSACGSASFHRGARGSTLGSSHLRRSRRRTRATRAGHRLACRRGALPTAFGPRVRLLPLAPGPARRRRGRRPDDLPPRRPRSSPRRRARDGDRLAARDRAQRLPYTLGVRRAAQPPRISVRPGRARPRDAPRPGPARGADRARGRPVATPRAAAPRGPAARLARALVRRGRGAARCQPCGGRDPHLPRPPYACRASCARSLRRPGGACARSATWARSSRRSRPPSPAARPRPRSPASRDRRALSGAGAVVGTSVQGGGTAPGDAPSTKPAARRPRSPRSRLERGSKCKARRSSAACRAERRRRRAPPLPPSPPLRPLRRRRQPRTLRSPPRRRVKPPRTTPLVLGAAQHPASDSDAAGAGGCRTPGGGPAAGRDRSGRAGCRPAAADPAGDRAAGDRAASHRRAGDDHRAARHSASARDGALP